MKSALILFDNIITNKNTGFTTFNMNKWNVGRVVNDVHLMDLEEPPKNKLRKIIFKDHSGLTTSQKLSIAGTLIGRKKLADADDIYETMLYLHEDAKKITIAKIAQILKVSTRTIYRNITTEIKREKVLLNEEI